jgi:hypothetical protein
VHQPVVEQAPAVQYVQQPVQVVQQPVQIVQQPVVTESRVEYVQAPV